MLAFHEKATRPGLSLKEAPVNAAHTGRQGADCRRMRCAH
jgi:hypothetical protein